MDQIKLTILGDRQSGKTRLALLDALSEAYQGKRVLHETHSLHVACNDLERTVELAERLDLETTRVSRSNGRYSIHFPSGGYIHFQTGQRRTELDDQRYDLMILDNTAGEAPSVIKRIVRTVTL